MARAIFIVTMLALIGRATFFLSPVRPECTESCPEDDVGGDCMPTCTCSDCCEDEAPVTVLYQTLERSSMGRHLPSAASTSLPPSAEPREILHIPKSLLAAA